ncbi:MAG TPA: hypothetical protein VKU38_09020 [Ktedonobacteraceae bacterium]|nr:hypothetical protein [Ktedonobacteraceae bacterium]
MFPAYFNGGGIHHNAVYLLLDRIVQVASQAIALLLCGGFAHLSHQLIAVGDIALLPLFLLSSLLTKRIDENEEACQGPAQT